jgi:hypothetical protein
MLEVLCFAFLVLRNQVLHNEKRLCPPYTALSATGVAMKEVSLINAHTCTLMSSHAYTHALTQASKKHTPAHTLISSKYTLTHNKQARNTRLLTHS